MTDTKRPVQPISESAETAPPESVSELSIPEAVQATLADLGVAVGHTIHAVVDGMSPDPTRTRRAIVVSLRARAEEILRHVERLEDLVPTAARTAIRRRRETAESHAAAIATLRGELEETRRRLERESRMLSDALAQTRIAQQAVLDARGHASELEAKLRTDDALLERAQADRADERAAHEETRRGRARARKWSAWWKEQHERERAARKEAERRAEEAEKYSRWLSEKARREANAAREAERQRDEAERSLSAEKAARAAVASAWAECHEKTRMQWKDEKNARFAAQAQVAALREALRGTAVDSFGQDERGCRLCGAHWYGRQDESHIADCLLAAHPAHPAPTSAPEEPTR